MVCLFSTVANIERNSQSACHMHLFLLYSRPAIRKELEKLVPKISPVASPRRYFRRWVIHQTSAAELYEVFHSTRGQQGQNSAPSDKTFTNPEEQPQFSLVSRVFESPYGSIFHVQTSIRLERMT